MMIGERIYELRSYFNGGRLISGSDLKDATEDLCRRSKKHAMGYHNSGRNRILLQSQTAPPGSAKIVGF